MKQQRCQRIQPPLSLPAARDVRLVVRNDERRLYSQAIHNVELDKHVTVFSPP